MCPLTLLVICVWPVSYFFQIFKFEIRRTVRLRFVWIGDVVLAANACSVSNFQTPGRPPAFCFRNLKRRYGCLYESKMLFLLRIVLRISSTIQYLQATVVNVAVSTTELCAAPPNSLYSCNCSHCWTLCCNSERSNFKWSALEPLLQNQL